MSKRILGLTAFLAIFSILVSSFAFAIPSFDVSIDRVRLNDEVVVESRTNLINDANLFSVIVDITAVDALVNGHVEISLRGTQTGDSVADSTGTFNLSEGSQSQITLDLFLLDRMKRETQFDLRVRVEDAEGRTETNTYRIKTESGRITGRALDISIDRVLVNGKVVASSTTNFIDEDNDFDILVEFTALEALEDTHVEAVLKDLRTGTVVADASSNFDLADGESATELLRLELLDQLKDSDSFELSINIIDAEGDSVQKKFGLRMRDGIVGGRALDISIDSVEVEDSILAENENNFIIIRSGENELDVDVRLTSLENIENARIEAILTFENGDVVADTTKIFDISKDETVLKKLDLPLIGRFEQNTFKLKIRIVNAEGDSEEKLYGLKISQSEFPFVISSISLSPESNVEAGKILIARLSLKNNGLVPLDGLNVKVSIPELGISTTKFVDQIMNNGKLTEIREDFILKILDNVPTGTYTVRSEVSSQFGLESEVREIPVFVLGTSDQSKQIVNDKIVINVPILNQDVNAISEVIYPLILTNQGPDADTYILQLDGANWANLRLSESNAFVLQPKESKTINIYVSSKGNAAGEQIFLVTLKSNDKVLKDIPLKGNVVATKGLLAAKLKNFLQVFLIAFVVVLVSMSFYFGIKRYVQSNGENVTEELPNQTEGEVYY